MPGGTTETGTASFGANRRRRRHRQSRGAVLWALGLFFAGQLGLRAYIEGERPAWRDPAFEIKAAALARLTAGEEKPRTILFFGSSQTVYGVRTGKLAAALSEPGRPVAAFNLGNLGSGPFTYLLYLQRLLQRGVRPDLVVLEGVPRHLYASGKPWDLEKFPAHVLGYRDLRTVGRYEEDRGDGLRREWWAQFPVPVHAHRLALVSQEAPFLLPLGDRMETWPAMNAHGWVPCPVRYRDAADHRRILHEVKETLGKNLGHVRPGSPLWPEFLELLDLTRRHGIPTVVLVLPEGPTLRSLYPPGTLAGFRADLAACERICGCRVVDLIDLCPEEAFYDSFHLLPEGADVLAAALADRLRPIVTERERPLPGTLVGRGKGD